MDLRKKILDIAKKKRRFQTSDVVIALNHQISRQYISKFIADLVSEKVLIKSGSTHKASYALPKNIAALGDYTKKKFQNNNLKEHEALEELKDRVPFIFKLRDNVRSIFDYAFSEMLNNAIEHSSSKNIEIEVAKRNHCLSFVVRDFGIGVFRNVMEQRHLHSELEAMQDLLKGKTTTAPKAHSGEGIFFTSKTADKFVLESFGYKMIVDNQIDDIFFEKAKRPIRGTKVTFVLPLASKRHLVNIFSEFQSSVGDFAFDKTKIQVKLYTTGTVHISRSQARRILNGLNKFRLIILDFDKVPTVGQAFADEIFRVFRNKHPEIKIEPINMNESVNFMVKRVDKG